MLSLLKDASSTTSSFRHQPSRRDTVAGPRETSARTGAVSWRPLAQFKFSSKVMLETRTSDFDYVMKLALAIASAAKGFDNPLFVLNFQWAVSKRSWMSRSWRWRSDLLLRRRFLRRLLRNWRRPLRRFSLPKWGSVSVRHNILFLDFWETLANSFLLHCPWSWKRRFRVPVYSRICRSFLWDKWRQLQN